MNRVVESANALRKVMALKDQDPGELAVYDQSLALTPGARVAAQASVVKAFEERQIDRAEAQFIYAALAGSDATDNGGWAAGVDTATKATITDLVLTSGGGRLAQNRTTTEPTHTGIGRDESQAAGPNPDVGRPPAWGQGDNTDYKRPSLAPSAMRLADTRSNDEKESAMRHMQVGALWFFGGAAASAVSYYGVSGHGGGTYVVFWGAVIYGLIRLVRGWNAYRQL